MQLLPNQTHNISPYSSIPTSYPIFIIFPLLKTKQYQP